MGTWRRQRIEWEHISLIPYYGTSRTAVKSELYISVHQVDSQEVSAACVIAVQQHPIRHWWPKRQLELHEGQITLRGLRPREDSIWKHCLIEEWWGQWETWGVGEKTWERSRSGERRGVSTTMVKSEEKEVHENRLKWRERTWGGGKESGVLYCLKAGLTCNQSHFLYKRNNNPHLNHFSLMLHFSN